MSEWEALTSSRVIRFNLFLVTAFPTLRPTTTPTRGHSSLGTWLWTIVKNGFLATEPVAFTSSYSCFFFKKNGGPSLTHCYSSETVSLVLPFFRRRARTFLPFLVLIRFRNPWSRFLFKFEGFRDVNDMVRFSFRPFSYELSILWVNGMRVKRIF